MNIYPAYIAVVLTAIILYRIFESINSENEYHLKHLFYHFVFQFFFAVHYTIYLITSFEFSIFITFLLRYFSYLFLYLFIKSVIISERAKLKFGHVALALLFLFIYYLNTNGIHLINNSNEVIIDSSIFHISANLIQGNEDFLFLIVVGQLAFSLLMIRLFYNSPKLTNNIENINHLKQGFTLYFVFFIMSILLVMNNILLLSFNLHFKYYSFTTRFIGFITFLIFLIYPKMQKELFSIKLKKKTTNKTKSIFDQILNYFEESEPFLNPNYNLSNLSIDTGFRNEIIRESIKSHSNKTVPAFINSHRIEKACKLIQEGYLKQYSMNALVEVSGFTSQPTFNRAFKLVSGKTPTEYAESYS